jgi:GT2 family glycosyltransferase
MSKVFAVIVSYNGAPWLNGCLRSLCLSEHPVRIVVVDNASQDESVAIARSVDGVEVVPCSRNVGFGRASNVGIAHALGQGADFVLLLNQDAEVEKNTVTELLSFMRDRDDVGMASPVHLDGSGTLLDKSFLLNYLAPQAPQFVFDAYRGDLARSYRVSSVNAAAWLVSRRCLEEVGGFDPIFFMYAEDDDYCARMRYHGFACFVVTPARIRHSRGFHQPAHRGSVWTRLRKSANFRRAQAIRRLKDPNSSGLLSAALRVLVSLVLEGLTNSVASPSPSPFLSSVLAASRVCWDLPQIARHKFACQARGPTWLEGSPFAKPLVSVGMPVYNGSRYIERAIGSLLNQTLRDFELIISDNASTDDTQAICESYAQRDKRIRYIRQPENVGAPRNYNAVVQAARGTLFKWSSASDECALDFLAKCVAALEADSSAVLAFGRTRFIDEEGTLLDVYDGDFSVTGSTPSERFEFVCNHLVLNNAQSAVIRLDALRKTGLDRLYPRGDPVLMAELALQGRWQLLPDVLLYRRTGRDNFTPQRTLAELTRIYDPRRRRPLALINCRRHWDYCTVALRAPISWTERLRTVRYALGRAMGDGRGISLDAKRLLKSLGMPPSPWDTRRFAREPNPAPVSTPPR